MTAPGSPGRFSKKETLMRITSPLPPKAYLFHMKEQMGSFMDFAGDRFTGRFLGRLFYVTHHSGYEWNRRITNEKNGAIGYVRSHEDGCEVCFIRLKGAFCLGQFLFLLLMTAVMVAVAALEIGVWNPIYLWAFPIMLVVSAMSTLIESLTERSQEGMHILNALLLDPSDPFSYSNNQNRI